MAAADRLVIRTRPDDEARKLARTIKRLAPSLKCVGCSGRDFALIEEPEKNFRSFFEREDVSVSPAFTVKHHVASLVCVRCGHLAQFSDGVVIDHAEPNQWGIDADDETGR
jgi:hypothetical protein